LGQWAWGEAMKRLFNELQEDGKRYTRHIGKLPAAEDAVHQEQKYNGTPVLCSNMKQIVRRQTINEFQFIRDS